MHVPTLKVPVRCSKCACGCLDYHVGRDFYACVALITRLQNMRSQGKQERANMALPSVCCMQS